jgi:putative FmdB family regulatory protein
MPTYEYECDKCGYRFEIRQSIHDEPLLRCEKCDTHNLYRIISGGLYSSIKKSDDEIKLGHLADRNRDRFSNDKKEYLLEKNGVTAYNKNLKKYGSPLRFDDSVSEKRLNKMTKEEQKKYIEKGP